MKSIFSGLVIISCAIGCLAQDQWNVSNAGSCQALGGLALEVAVSGNYANVVDYERGLGTADCSTAIDEDCTPSPFVLDATPLLPIYRPMEYSHLFWCVDLCAGYPFILEIGPLSLDDGEVPIFNIQPGCNNGIEGCDIECEAASFNFFPQSWQFDSSDSTFILEVFVISSGCACIQLEAIMSVELLSLEAIPGDREITLNWATASETDNDRFEIERDGVIVGREPAHNYATGSSYSWTETKLVNGREYTYSLVSVSIEGERETIGTASATPRRDAATVCEYALDQNYPNPFNPETNISFDIKEAGDVRLAIYNATGQIVAKLVEGELSAGRHTVRFDASSLPSGLYFYRLEAGEFRAAKKLVVIK